MKAAIKIRDRRVRVGAHPECARLVMRRADTIAHLVVRIVAVGAQAGRRRVLVPRKLARRAVERAVLVVEVPLCRARHMGYFAV